MDLAPTATASLLSRTARLGLREREEGGDSLVPPHAMSTAENRSDDIRVRMRVMSWLSPG